MAKCCPKGQHFPAINDNLYKVQFVISAMGSRAELSSTDIYKDITNTRRNSCLGAVKDGRKLGKNRVLTTGWEKTNCV